jgi:hypothetical protein
MSRLGWSGWTGVGAIAGVVGVIVAIVALIQPSAPTTPPAESAPPTVAARPAAPPSAPVAPAIEDTPSPSAEAEQPASMYVDDYAKTCAIALTTGPASINGDQYAHTVLQWAGDTDNAITVSRKATRFQAVVGIRDDASDQVRAQFELDGDNGRQLFTSRILGLGETQPVDVSLDGVLRITLRVKAVSKTWGYAGWGDARLAMSAAPNC